MSKKGIGILCAVLAFLVVLVGTVGGTYWALEHYALVGGHFYSTSASFLDLRDRELSAEDYGALTRRIPNCEILWNIPFQGTYLSSDAEEITVAALSDDDAYVLGLAKHLKTIHAEECTDYPQLMAVRKVLPGCRMLYSVAIDGKEYDQDTKVVTVPGLTAEDAQKLVFLPELSQVAADGCSDYALLLDLQAKHPEWNVEYSVPMGGDKLTVDTVSAEVTGASLDEMQNGIPGLPELQSLTLINPDASYEEVESVRKTYPNVQITLRAILFGEEYETDLQEVDISAEPIESIEQAKRWASYFPKLEKLIVNSGEIDNEEMAAFREEMRPEYKVVWTVVHGTGKFGCFELRTDATYFMPLKYGIYWFHDDDMVNAKYCEDIIAMDVGHMTITDVSFARYMPHLKYLILNLTHVEDISPLSSCKELVFLELCDSYVKDYSPLLECTALEDLNLGRTWGDAEPIGHMTWLKNLWWMGRGHGTRLQIQDKLPDTYMFFKPDADSGMTDYGWRRLPNYYAMRDALEMFYMD